MGVDVTVTASIEFIEGGKSKGPDLPGFTAATLSSGWDIFIDADAVDFCVTFVDISRALELGGMEGESLL